VDIGANQAANVCILQQHSLAACASSDRALRNFVHAKEAFEHHINKIFVLHFALKV
jgi:hypothetical protein